VKVELSGVEVRYGRTEPVLSGLDLQVLPGRPVVVRGTNGSGKSTLLRVVAGCAKPTAGRVTGRPGRVGYLPDRFPSQLRMPAASYLRHMAALHQVGSAPAVGLLGALGFTGGLRVPMAHLSKGNAQKVALAQALCSGAALLVLDEPWSGLDTDAAGAVSTLIARMVEDGAAVVITDHTGTSGGLASRDVHDLVDGRLVPATPATVLVTLVADDPQAAVARLAGLACTVAGHRITVRVPEAHRDDVLRAALSWGCGVEAVGPSR
jgi:ABC-2 type transport system ATP-binding protein